MKSRITMNTKIADMLREYYRCTTPDAVLFKAQCFSNPQIRSHACNALAKLPGDEECSFCHNNPKKLCEYTCDINRFCLSVFAYRLGIGGDELAPAVKANLQLPYKELVDAIFEVFAADPAKPEPEKEVVLPEETQPEEVHEEHIEPPVEEAKGEEMPEVDPNAVEEVIESVEDLVTVLEASKIWGCTPPNIYAKIKAGTLTVRTKDGVKGQWISREELDRVKSQGRTKRNKTEKE